ncbi:hypothetical protein ACR6C2_22125 [Streptomyces sp. INA 01156]
MAGSVLLAAAVLGGAGYTVVTVENADRDPGAPTWDIDEAEAADGKKAAPTGLAAMLVPYGGKGYERGPDLGTFGADAVLSGSRPRPCARSGCRECRVPSASSWRRRSTGSASRAWRCAVTSPVTPCAGGSRKTSSP